LYRQKETIKKQIKNQIIMAKNIFINLPIKDLKRSVEFFTKLGFTFNPQFTDENATCMIIGENIYAMLLVEKRFRDFTTKQICNTATHTELIIAIDADNNAGVDELANKAIAAGASESRPAEDLGFMYQRSFQDLDGHIWEVFYMDLSKLPQA
jgi:predicted lactoylglutathione lyase